VADEEAIQLLAQHPLFAGSSPPEGCQGQLHVLKYPPDMQVVRGGMEQQSVLVLVEGSAALFARLRGRTRQFLAGLVEAPSVIGDDDRHAASTWSYSVSTIQASTFVRVPNELFDRWIQADAKLAVGLYRSASRRGIQLRKVLERMLLEPTDKLLLTLLWDLSRPTSDSSHVVPLTPSRFARALGVDRKTITRSVQRLSDEGLLRVNGREAALLYDRRSPAGLSSGERQRGSTWRISEFRRRRGDLEAASFPR
jgi:CRP-like cAMP-binding protein